MKHIYIYIRAPPSGTSIVDLLHFLEPIASTVKLCFLKYSYNFSVESRDKRKRLQLEECEEDDNRS